MNNAPYISMVSRALVKGAKCLISGREFVSTDPKQFEQCWEDACNHALSILAEQPPGLSLASRQNLYRESQQQ